MQIFEFQDIASTNIEARKLYESGTQTPFWTRADRQSAGKGRRGRVWTSQAGNLYASGVYPWTGAIADAAKLSFVAALAVCKTLDAYELTSPPQLKWPNDVLIDGAKISGILLENIGKAVIIGIGINLVSHPEGTDFPATHLLNHIKSDALNDAETIFTGAANMLPLLAKEFSEGLAQF
ncbi:MAG: biotin--[acetyl-CoA-carboxylase] ligase, partial [Litorimonas sp.]